MIELININLDNVTLGEQYIKANEEQGELYDALINYDDSTEESKQHVIEEYCDVLQAYLGLLQKHGISAEEVMEHYPKHLEKLKNRPRKEEK